MEPEAITAAVTSLAAPSVIDGATTGRTEWSWDFYINYFSATKDRPPVDPAVIAEKLEIAQDTRKKGRTAAEATSLVGWSRATLYRHQQSTRTREKPSGLTSTDREHRSVVAQTRPRQRLGFGLRLHLRHRGTRLYSVNTFSRTSPRLARLALWEVGGRGPAHEFAVLVRPRLTLV